MSKEQQGGFQPPRQEPTATSDGPTGAGYERTITETKFWEELMTDIYGPRKGGAIIFIDAENARKGVAKTSGAVALACLLANKFGYRLRTDDVTLSGGHYLQRYQEQPGEDQPSVLVLDEIVGGGAGDARRAMSNQNLDFGRAWQLLRSRRVVTLATIPDWNEVDTRLQKLAGYRLWCRERPIGYFQPYKITVPFNSSTSIVKTKSLTRGDDTPRVRFPDMDREENPFYQHLVDRKNALVDAAGWDADIVEGIGGDDDEEERMSEEEIQRRELQRVAIRLYQPWDDDNDTTYEDVADAIDFEKTPDWVGKQIRKWERGRLRDLVEEPSHV